jgi:hypothetical protein
MRLTISRNCATMMLRRPDGAPQPFSGGTACLGEIHKRTDCEQQECRNKPTIGEADYINEAKLISKDAGFPSEAGGARSPPHRLGTMVAQARSDNRAEHPVPRKTREREMRKQTHCEQ